MPKRGKRKHGDGRDEYEGRPADITFAAFLQAPVSQSSSVSFSLQPETGKARSSYDEPAETLPSEDSQFTVTRTKKGKLPITYENRSKGKKVTVIGNVSGNADALLSEMRKRLGVGGVSRGTFVELQGDQQKHVEEFLSKQPWVK